PLPPSRLRATRRPRSVRMRSPPRAHSSLRLRQRASDDKSAETLGRDGTNPEADQKQCRRLQVRAPSSGDPAPVGGFLEVPHRIHVGPRKRDLRLKRRWLSVCQQGCGPRCNLAKTKAEHRREYPLAQKCCPTRLRFLSP